MNTFILFLLLMALQPLVGFGLPSFWIFQLTFGSTAMCQTCIQKYMGQTCSMTGKFYSLIQNFEAISGRIF
jgi:hypothetical protein